MATQLQRTIVLGPVRGHALSVNVLPRRLRVCNLECQYCAYHARKQALPSGEGWPSPTQIAAAVAARLERAVARREWIDRLVLTGHGEPTLHPEFEEVVDRVREARNVVAPRVALAVSSNSRSVSWPAVERALSRLDEQYLKLDAADVFTLRSIDGGTLDLECALDAMSRLPHVIIRATFVRDARGVISNATMAHVERWMACLRRVDPVLVQICTVDRRPLTHGVHPVSVLRLREIAARVRGAGFPVQIVPSFVPAGFARLRPDEVVAFALRRDASTRTESSLSVTQRARAAEGRAGSATPSTEPRNRRDDA